jgi:hypothetical protein
VGRDLEQFSLETVRIFLSDAIKTGFCLAGRERRAV